MRNSFVYLGIMAGLMGCAHKQAGSASSEPPASASSEASSTSGATEKSASAELVAKSGATTLAGSAAFRSTAAGVMLVLQVTGAPPGQHGAHLHEKGDCSDAEAKNAGGHWNPAGHKHGAPPPASAHLGDLGNLTVGEDGIGRLELTSAEWTIGDGSPHDVVGKAVVIHGGPDDLATDPAGNSGPRIGCGVIQ
jgi:superoxide dismutase, Cu-Zn family